MKMKVLLIIFIMIMLAVVVYGNDNGSGNKIELNTIKTRKYRVQPYDTLWSIINNEIKNREQFDGHQLISILKKINNLKSSTLRVGQTLLVPIKITRRNKNANV